MVHTRHFFSFVTGLLHGCCCYSCDALFCWKDDASPTESLSTFEQRSITIGELYLNIIVLECNTCLSMLHILTLNKR